MKGEGVADKRKPAVMWLGLGGEDGTLQHALLSL